MGCVPLLLPPASGGCWQSLAHGPQADGTNRPRDQGSTASIFFLLIFTICSQSPARDCSAPCLAPFPGRPGQRPPHSQSPRRLHLLSAICPLCCSRNCFSHRTGPITRSLAGGGGRGGPRAVGGAGNGAGAFCVAISHHNHPSESY